ncbi:MAG: hypothetical protein HN576_03685 [Bacteriovoracaceae bacterium]|nr:hypothetical protein [Bacteriovoracaceae bacterium]
MKKICEKLWNNPVAIWCLIFILINILFRATGGANPASRYATMRSMVEQSSFMIDSYKHWTVDWAQKPGGGTYSNKAPGPMFIGFPLFFIIEKMTKNGRKKKLNDKGHRINYVSSGPRVLMSLALQLIPFALLCFHMIKKLDLKNLSLAQINFLCLSLFFGTTISLLLNVYFGHGMTAIFLLLIFYGLQTEKPLLIGAGFGFALLCEYTVALILPVLLISLLYQNKKDFRWVKNFFLGGIIPGLLWAWYHFSSTGSLFQIPAQFQNPGFETVKHIKGSFAGMFHPYPNLENLYHLLLGPIRGLLFTQPWVLFSLVAPILLIKKIREDNQTIVLFIFTYGSFLVLLLMNSMFDEWHSGWMVGPRYMSSIFPCIAMFIGMNYKSFSNHYLKLLWVGLICAISFRCLVYASTILAPDVPLWPYLMMKVTPKTSFRILVFITLLSLGFYRTKKIRLVNV